MNRRHGRHRSARRPSARWLVPCVPRLSPRTARRAIRTTRAIAAGLVAALFAFGIAGAATAQGAPAGQTVQIEMGERGSEYFFNLKEITVPVGAVRFTFRNNGTRNHNFVVKLPGGEQRIPDLGRDREYEQTFTFTRPGTFDFMCDLPTHAQRGMMGTLTVTGAAAAPTSAGGAASQPPAAATPARASSGVPGGGSPGGIPVFVSLAIHIPAAIAWIGIALYQAIVVTVPYLTTAQRASLLQRPRWVVVATIPIFGATGVYQTIFNPISPVTDVASLESLRLTTSYGLALFWKHGFVLASVALTLALTFWFAPRLTAAAGEAGTGAALPSRTPSLLTWANVAACAALLVCVAIIVFQLH